MERERYIIIDRENPKRKIYLSPDELQLLLLLAEERKREVEDDKIFKAG